MGASCWVHDALFVVGGALAGWFSLNVPSGLTLYWFVNNMLSTGQQLYLKATVKVRRGSGTSARSAAGSAPGSTACAHTQHCSLLGARADAAMHP